MNTTFTTCFCCNKERECFVRCSTVGAASMPYCVVCAGLAAENKELLKELFPEPEIIHNSIMYYDEETDNYYYYADNEKLILETNNDVLFENATDYYNHLIEGLKRIHNEV